MTPEQWANVQRVLHEAIPRDGTDRDAYLESACAGDAALRRDVDALLNAHARAGKLDALEDRIRAPLAALLHGPGGAPPATPILPRYEVLERLGSGGMGVVYRAHDRRLDRHVALKFLPPHLATADAAKRRFLAEAQATAALEHPNICTIYEIGNMDDGQLYIAMPFYDGETLDRRILRGPMPVGETIRIALAIADGLAKAHERGIIHRDVKPPNVMITVDGLVKILDFGIAKLVNLGADGATQPGTRVGTVAYMSPEQAGGTPVDHRTDVWSLGVVLYEMLAGERPFLGDDERGLIDAIQLRDPQPLSSRFEELPSSIDGIIATALAKRPADRYESMRALVQELASLHAVLAPAVGASRPTAARHERPRTTLALGGERRHVTILVATVSGYASVIERCPPDETERVLGRVRNAAVDVTRRYGASIEGLQGDQVRAVFGVPEIHEDDALRAVRAALELHACVREIAASVADGPARAIRMQSGIHTAPVVIHRPRRDDTGYQVIGAALHSAARLSAIAATDEILASGECHRLVSPFIAAEPSMPVLLTAGAPPAVAYRIRGESGLTTRLEAAERAGLTPYAGRGAELGTLKTRLAQACAGDGQLVAIVGEAGAGKSRLLYELRQGLVGSDVRVLKGRCQSYAGVAPYRPFIEALLTIIGPGNGGEQRTSLEQIVSRIVAIDSSLADFVPLYLHLLSIDSQQYRVPRHLQGERFKAAMLDALVAIVTLYAQRRPAVVLFEDWHWVDDASRDVLRQLSEILPAFPLLVVVSCRPDGSDEWGSADNRTVIHLGPLDRIASAAIMQSVLQANRVEPELARQIHERTGGNPFFLEEVCQTLIEDGTVTVSDGEALADASGPVQLPETVQAVIRTRLGRLDGDALEVLRVASVIGREFSCAVLEHVLMGAIAAAPALRRLNGAGLLQQTSVVPEQSYRFKHVLTQEVTYSTLLEHQRKTLHGAVGRALERLYSSQMEERLGLLAHHFSHAEEWREAVRYGMQAAERAAALSQFSDALAALERAQSWLMHLEDNADRRETLAEILLRQERVCETLGLRGRQQRLVDELIALLAPVGASAKLAEAYLRQGDVSTLLKKFDAAGRALETALRIARERGDAAAERNALRSIGLLRWHEGNNAEALAIAEDALAIDRERDDMHAVAGDLANLGSILRGMGEYERARLCLEEALELRAVREDPITQSFVLQHLANVHRSLGNAERALEYLRRGAEQTRELRLPIQRSFHLTAIAHIYLQQGTIEDSLRVYGEAVDLSRKARHADGLAQGVRTLGEVLFGLRRDAEALPLFTDGVALFAQLEDGRGEALMWSRIAAINERTGSFMEAGTAWEAARALARQVGGTSDELDAIEGMARCARRRSPNDAGAAIALYEEAIALASARGEQQREGSVRNHLGILHWERGAYASALQQYEAALRIVRGLGDAVHEGLILNSLGLTLSRLRRHDEARTVLAQGLAVNRHTGESLLESHTLAVLGEVYADVGRLEDAAAHYELAIVIRREMQDQVGTGHLLTRLAHVHDMQSNTSPAE